MLFHAKISVWSAYSTTPASLPKIANMTKSGIVGLLYVPFNNQAKRGIKE